MANDRRLLLPVVAGLLVVGVALGLTARVGIDVGRDSKSYLDVADDLRDGRGFRDPDHEDATHFPPGTALAIAAVAVTGVSTTSAALVVNGLAWATTVVAGFALYRSAGGRTGPVAWVVVLWLAGGGTFTLLFGSVLSEGPFLAAALLAIVAGERWARKPTVANAAATWACCVATVAFRYIGVALVVALALRVLHQRRPARATIAALALVGSTVLPVGLWYLRYRGLHGADVAPIADRSFAPGDVFHSLGALGSVFGGGLPYSENNQIVLAKVDGLVRAALAAVGLLIVAAAGWWVVRTSRGGKAAVARTIRTQRDEGRLLAVHYALASIAILAAWRFSIGYHILARYWLVAIVPLVVVLAAAASQVDAARLSPTVRRACGAGAVLFLGANAVVSLRLLAG
ncbi:hypothetical protein [Aquihabitans sp. G128]|uniref:hypothetical protein n=1 Tax=Aquihabitans sp. G128 TaxID=2849779 RepID=UPI0020B234DA|nr:hypothetical protein [Aquihabitans sp. G128]